MAKGDIVLIKFPFTDLTASKLRPAVILFENSFDITVCFITTQMSLIEPTDIELTPNPNNGLRKTSFIKTNKIATLDRSLAKGLLGKLSKNDIQDLDKNLKIILQLQ